ncbi:penicillin-binding protein 2 [Kocuria coralli]|uniref:Penicillin-binding protein 2 n=1 Tax=Kocuria coralli TaxID=1461025 RepID=A0A5J5KTG9_9MICC|nr:penicillin-binding protein 2 [Kocuria coralli]KAA9392923.1 penicillin-binding protein 2 [Kocuria coralli]
MNRAIRHVWVAAVALFAVLLLALTFIMFFQQRSLAANAWNTRALYEQFGRDRGSILAGGEEVAYSVPADGDYAYQREYRDGEAYAPLTGYFSPIYGSTGLESAMGEQLSGESDSQFYDRVMATLSGNQPTGASVEMTVDPQLQELAASLLEGRNGSIVALEPSTGRILAMASSPSFDPNEMSSRDSAGVIETAQRLNGDPNQPLVNRAIGGDLYSPASTFKIVDTVAALESGEYDTDTVIPNPQDLELPNTNIPLPNYVGGPCASRTEADLEFALNNSCNTPFAQIAMDLGQDRIRETAENFGYGQDLSIPLNVSHSTFPTDLDDASLAMSAIGQYDVRSTPLQVAMISSAIANDGVLMRPNLIEEVRSSDLSVIDSFQAEQMQRSTSSDVAGTVKDLMVSAVDNGIASGAQVPGYSVAGKTGTAEVGTAGSTDSWFTGFAPADDPQVAIAVVYEDVEPGAASLATPSAQQMMEAVLNG